MENFLQNVLKVISLFVSLMIAFFNMVTGSGKDPGTTTPPTTGTTTAISTESTKQPTSKDGSFVITAYAWGHGVGMSQQGAIEMAKNGNNYVAILKHYYTGVDVYTDKATPTTVKYGSESMDLVKFLCLTVKQEIGDESPEQAIRAQAAAIYTFAKYYKFSVKTSQIAMDRNFKYEGTNLHKYVLSYLGMTDASSAPQAKFVSQTKDGEKAICAIFGDSAAGHTTDATSVWGGTYPYLVPVTTPEDYTKKTVSISVPDMKKYIESYADDNNVDITLGSDPSTWLKINTHDSSVNSGIGYVTSMKVGDKEMKGYTFRTYVVDNAIRSHCFTLSYVPAA